MDSFDTEGTKLKKIVSGGETTDYEEDDIYVNGKLYQTSHDEGRIVEGVYEYNITDQNNDLRVAFKDSCSSRCSAGHLEVQIKRISNPQ